MVHVAWHTQTWWRNALSEEEFARLLNDDPAFSAIEDRIEQVRSNIAQWEAQVQLLSWSQSWVDQAAVNRISSTLSTQRNQLQVLEWQKSQILKSRFETEQLTNPNLVANNFWNSWLTIDPVTWLQVSNDTILDPSQTWNIAADLSRRTWEIISFQQWAWEEQLQAIQEARNLASGIWQAQLWRTWQVFDQASRWALAAWAVNEGIIWGIASRAWASGAQRLASINAAQAWTAENLWQLNAQRLEQENAILLNYLNGINTAITNENAIRSNVTENVGAQLGTLRQDIWTLSQNELGFQRGLPDLLTTRAWNQLTLQGQQLQNAQAQLQLNELAASLWVTVPSIIWWVWTVASAAPVASSWWGTTTSWGTFSWWGNQSWVQSVNSQWQATTVIDTWLPWNQSTSNDIVNSTWLTGAQIAQLDANATRDAVTVNAANSWGNFTESWWTSFGSPQSSAQNQTNAIQSTNFSTPVNQSNVTLPWTTLTNFTPNIIWTQEWGFNNSATWNNIQTVYLGDDWKEYIQTANWFVLV